MINSKFAAIMLIALVFPLAACGKPAAPPSTVPPVTPPTANNVTPPVTEPPPISPPAVNTTPPVTTPPVTTPPVVPPGGVTAPGPADVWVQGFSFNPPALIVPVSTTVTWTNKDGDQHDVTSDTRLFAGQLQGNGGTFKYTFGTRGVFDYSCTLHAGMTGKIIVQ